MWEYLAVAGLLLALYWTYSYVSYFFWWLEFRGPDDPPPILIRLLASTSADDIITTLQPAEGLTKQQELTLQLLEIQAYLNTLTVQ